MFRVSSCSCLSPILWSQMSGLKNEDVVWAVPKPEWSTILLPTKVRLMLEVWLYITYASFVDHMFCSTFTSLWPYAVSICQRTWSQLVWITTLSPIQHKTTTPANVRLTLLRPNWSPDFQKIIMTTSWLRNAFHAIGIGGFTAHSRISPKQRASDVELWCFLVILNKLLNKQTGDLMCHDAYKTSLYLLSWWTWLGNRFQLISPGQNARHFADDIFRCIFVNEKVLHFDLKFTEVCSLGSN